MKTKNILIICQANYCRSPVAEYILKHTLKNRYMIESAGLNPLLSGGMDIRSKNFLDSLNIEHQYHNPKRVDKTTANNASFIFAMDTKILQELNLRFPQAKPKIKIFNFLNPLLKITDPYKMDETEYNLIMSNIFSLSCSITDYLIDNNN